MIKMSLLDDGVALFLGVPLTNDVHLGAISFYLVLGKLSVCLAYI